MEYRLRGEAWYSMAQHGYLFLRTERNKIKPEDRNRPRHGHGHGHGNATQRPARTHLRKKTKNSTRDLQLPRPSVPRLRLGIPSFTQCATLECPVRRRAGGASRRPSLGLRHGNRQQCVRACVCMCIPRFCVRYVSRLCRTVLLSH